MTRPADPALVPVPHDLAAERRVLATLLGEAEAVPAALAVLDAGDFYAPAHAAVYAAVQALAAARQPVDFGSVESELTRRGDLPMVGGKAGLLALYDGPLVWGNIDHYARLVAETAALRRLITVGGQIAGMGYDQATPFDDVCSAAERALLQVTQARRRAADCTSHEALSAYMDGLAARMAGTTPGIGWATGLPDLTQLTRGGRPGKLWVITGESGGGKSTVAQMLGDAMSADGARVGAFSLEMDKDELMERQLAARARVDSAALAAGELTPDELRRVQDAYSDLLAEPAWRLITGGGFTFRDIAAQARRWQADGGLDVLIVDYLQLVRLVGKDKVSELDDLCNGLKTLATELRICLITAAQLNKGAVGKEAKDWDDYLRGSAAIKQAADLVLAVAPEGDRPTDPRQSWPVTLELTKHRGGPVGPVAALWWLAYSRLDPRDTVHREWSH